MPYNQVSPPLMRSPLDQVPGTKETLPDSIQPHSAAVPEPVVEVSCILMNSLVFTYVVWHPAAAVALLGEHEIHACKDATDDLLALPHTGS